MGNDPPLIRQWILLKTLAARHYGVTVDEMAREAGVGIKTIRRDLQAFMSAGFPLEETFGDHGRKHWKLSTNGGPPQLNFALDEALALYLGRRFLEPLAGTMLWQAAQSAFRKVRACLGKSALSYMDQMAASLYQTAVGASDYSAKGDLIDGLMQGIEERKATHIEYQSMRATEPVTYEVFPYSLAFHKNSMYLVAFSRDHNEIRTFKVDRISAAEVSRFPFQMPDDFDLQTHLAGSFGIYHGQGNTLVKIKFLPPVARYVQEGRWHQSQQLSKQKDGSLLAEFRLSSTEEIKKWILSFGRNAVVLEPNGLRDEIAEEARHLIEMYMQGRSFKTSLEK